MKKTTCIKAIPVPTPRRAGLMEFMETHRRTIIAALLLLGLLWRVIFLLETGTATTVAYLTVDERYHHETASEIAKGQWLQDGANAVFFRAPFYYYLLGGVYRIVPDSMMVARVLQILLSTASCLLPDRPEDLPSAGGPPGPAVELFLRPLLLLCRAVAL
jgi:hypothetical protein